MKSFSKRPLRFFGDPLALTFEDPDHSIAEERFITVGMAKDRKILLVSHLDKGDTIRIISARLATPAGAETI